MKLVIVGEAPYSTQYIRMLKQTRDPRIIFTGYVFGEGYRELRSYAYAYIQATEVGGTHPGLLEAMGTEIAYWPMTSRSIERCWRTTDCFLV